MDILYIALGLGLFGLFAIYTALLKGV